MLQKKSNNSLYFPHNKQYLLEISQTLSLCSNCSCAVIMDKSREKISTIKPLKYHKHDDIFYPCFLLQSEDNKKYDFVDQKKYNKIRSDFVKKLKSYYKKLNLNLKTFFSALDYLDRICSGLSKFELDTIDQICDLCIILSAKLNEKADKAFEVKHFLYGSKKSNYMTDEIFLIKKLLNYDLIKITSYDILIDILKCGFIFNNEEFLDKKMYTIYDKIENMLYLFSESKHWISMTPMEIAMGIVGWARDYLGLVPFSKNIQTVFMKEIDHIHNYIKCLNKIKKCFKIKEGKNDDEINRGGNNIINSNNHSDSTKDSNSDNNY